jgi:cysteine synthase A
MMATMRVGERLAPLQIATARRGARQLTVSAPRRAIYENITETIGRTPVVKVQRLAPAGVELYVKCEFFNPLGSVKDRLAKAIIEDAEKSGALKPGGTVVEATSGNTGISLAMVCAQRGYNFVSTMAASFSVERRKVMRMLGAKVVITPAALGGTGMVLKAEELAAKHGWCLARQFENDANPEYHANTTGPEILLDFAGRRLDYWVTGYGTGGTFQGTGKVLKLARPDMKIILSEPKGAPLVTSGTPQERKEVLGQFGAPASAHPAWTPHPIQGWTPNFIPKITEDGLNLKLQDEVVLVDPNEAMKVAQALAQKEGIFTGTSGGATVATALEVAKRAPKGSVLLAMIADTGERYLSTPLFADIDAEMNDAELELCKSTPTGQP